MNINHKAILNGSLTSSFLLASIVKSFKNSVSKSTSSYKMVSLVS